MKSILGNSLSKFSLSRNSPVKKKPQRTVSDSTSTSSPSVKGGKLMIGPRCPINEPSEDVAVIKRLWDQWQPSGYKGADAMVEFFESPDAVFSMDDHPDVPCGDLASLIGHIHECLPDCRFDYERIYQGEEPNTIVMEGHKFSGTHTGAPYTFMPGKMPAIPASGKRVENDEEKFFFTMSEEHKIKHVALVALGRYTGPSGIYLNLGGTIETL